jgi:uncharacterized protein YcgL (UPF0745 family)
MAKPRCENSRLYVYHKGIAKHQTLVNIMAEDVLPCWVYRSPRKQEMYLYLAAEDDFSAVPDALLDQFGEPIPVIELELCSERKLARENVETVMANLREKGFHLQMPPKLQPDMYHGNPV